MKELETELLVIGGGPAGYPAAFYGLDLGMQVTMVDESKNPGGVCLYRGCIPSKALLHLAKLIREAHEAPAWGVSFGDPKIDLEKIRSWKESVVSKLTGGLGALGKQRKLAHIQGHATFEGPTSVFVRRTDGSEERIRFKHCILASGSCPVKLPGIALQSERLWDSTDALELREIPSRLLVVGGGYIGLELGMVYSAFGSKVSVVEMQPSLLPGADADLVTPLARRLERQFDSIVLGTRVVNMSETASGIVVSMEGPNGAVNQEFDVVLVAIGRTPNSGNLGLEKTRVEIDRRGFIVVDPQRRSAEPTIFAIGDVAGEPMLAHKGTAEAKVAVEAIAGKKQVFEPRGIPAVVFTDPEIAWVGMTETEAKQKNIDVRVAKFPWSASGRALTLARTEGVTKLIADPESGRLLGMGVCGAGAGELISEGALALEMGVTIKDIALTIHPHPTLSESVMEAAEAYFGHCTHLMRPV